MDEKLKQIKSGDLVTWRSSSGKLVSAQVEGWRDEGREGRRRRMVVLSTGTIELERIIARQRRGERPLLFEEVLEESLS